MIVRHQYLIASGLIFLSVVTRLWLHIPNMTLIGAAALFAGAYLADKRLGVFVPIVALAISDMVLGTYEPWVMASVYGSFALIGGIGMMLRAKKTPSRVVIASLSGSLLFYLITNFVVWIATPWYAKTFFGLVQSYTFAIPFFRNMLVGDVIFTGMLFAVPILVKSVFKIQLPTVCHSGTK